MGKKDLSMRYAVTDMRLRVSVLLKGCRDRKWSRSHCQMNSAGNWAISV